MTAKEARFMSDNYNPTPDAMIIVDEIMEEIKKSASNGSNFIYFNLYRNQKYKIVCQIITDLGFEIERDAFFIESRIIW